MRVVRPVLGGETYELAEVFEAACMLNNDLEIFLGRHILLVMVTDS